MVSGADQIMYWLRPSGGSVRHQVEERPVFNVRTLIYVRTLINVRVYVD